MRIRTIRLQNGYKRFHDLTINLGANPKKIIALVGPNGSGKSSVFDGMLFLKSAYRAIGSFNRRDNSFHSMNGAVIQPQDITIHFDTGEEFGQVNQRKNAAGNQNTIFNIRSSYRYNSTLNITQQQATPDIRENNYGASTSADLDDKMTMNYQRLVVYINNHRKTNDLTDRQAKEQVIGQLNTILSNCLNITIEDHGDILAGRGTLYFRKGDQPAEFSFNVLSAGEKEIVDILLDTFLKQQEYNETIYLIDEPELHLNTAIQGKVLVELSNLIPDTCQLWIATHSIGFLNALKNELNDQSDIIYMEGNLATEAVTITPMIKSRANWNKIFKTALEDMTGLLAPEIIIYCEGKVEPSASGGEQGTDAEIYNEIFNVTHPNALFVSSGGQTTPDKYAAVALKVLGKAFDGVQLLLLKDKDIMNGRPTTSQERQQFLNEASFHRMLIRKEIENYLFDFEIIHKAFPLVTEAQYQGVIPNILAEDVKEATGRLMELCQVNNIRGMNREAFKKSLAKQVTPDTVVYQELVSVVF